MIYILTNYFQFTSEKQTRSSTKETMETWS